MTSNLSNDYRENYECIARDDIKKDLVDVKYKQQQQWKLYGYLRKHVADLDNKIILDLGCAKGYFLDYLGESKFRYGGDISFTYCRYVRNKGFSTVQLNAEELPFNNSIDVIVASDILEHVLDLTKAIRSIYKALRKQGIFLMRVPYKEDITKYSKKRGFKYDFGHLRSFDEEKIEQELSNLFKVVKFYHDGFAYYGTRLKGIWQKVFHKTVGRLIDLVYDGQWEVMPNWLGNLVCRPIELVAVAIKI